MPRYRGAPVTFGVPALITAALALLIGGPGLAIAAIAALPWFAWRFDNDAGTWLPLACVFLLVLGILAALLTLAAVLHVG